MRAFQKAFLFQIIFTFLVLLFSSNALAQQDGVSGSASPNQIGGPSLGGSDQFSGTFQHSLPIIVPPGRVGAQPTVALNYSSSRGNGWIGVGWSYNTGYIERSQRFGVPVGRSDHPLFSNNTASGYSDQFGFEIQGLGQSGEIVPNGTSGNFQLKNESSWFIFRRIGDAWRAIDRDGRVYLFGSTADERMAHPDFPAGSFNSQWPRTVRWYLSSVTDKNGNQILFEYQKDSNLTNINHSPLYPSKILYGGNVNDSSVANDRCVTFKLDPQTRADPIINYRLGFRLKTARRLESIETGRCNGSEKIRTYQLIYEQAHYTKRSRLTRFQECGSDGTTCLPQRTFGYNDVNTSFSDDVIWTGTNGFATSAEFQIRDRSDGRKTRVDFMDMNGDALTDRVIRSTNYWDGYYLQLNTGSSFEPLTRFGQLDRSLTHTSWHNDFNYIYNATTSGQTNSGFWDMNGDSLPDKITLDGGLKYSYQSNTGQSGNGAGGVQGLEPLQDLFPLEGSGNNRAPFYSDDGRTHSALVDMNGDGRIDRVTRDYVSGGSRFLVQINNTKVHPWASFNGLGVTANRTLSHPLSFNLGTTNPFFEFPFRTHNVGGNGNQFETRISLIDMNGDGLVDIVNSNDSQSHKLTVQYNMGSSFDTPRYFGDIEGPNRFIKYVQNISNVNVTTTNLVDMNADGLPDWIFLDNNEWMVQFNTGESFEPAVIWSNACDAPAAEPIWECAFTSQDRNDSEVTRDLVDINGDKVPDFIKSVNESQQNIRVRLNNTFFADLLTSVDNGLGASTMVSYKSSATVDNRDDNGKHMLPKIFPVVESIVVDDGNPGDGTPVPITTTFDYEGGFYDHNLRAFKGFGRVTSEANQLRVVTYFHQAGGRDYSALGEFEDTFESKRGTPFRTEKWIEESGTWRLHSVTLNKLDAFNLSGGLGRNFSYIKSTIHKDFTTTGNHRATARDFLYEQHTGNLLETQDYGEVFNVDDKNHTFSDIPDGVLRTISSFYDTLGDIRNRRSAVQMRDEKNNLLGATRFSYDNRGNLKSTSEFLVSESRYIVEARSYDGLGNQLTTRGPTGTVTTFVVEPTEKIFNTEVGMHGHKTFFEYDLLSGMLIKETDIAGNVAETEYDELQRVKNVYKILPNGTRIWLENTEYLYTQFGTQTIKYTNNGLFPNATAPNIGVNTYKQTLFAGSLGKQFREESQVPSWMGMAPTACIASYSLYNELALPSYQTNPHFSCIGTAQGGLSIEYDQLGRTIAKVMPQGTAASPTSPTTTQYGTNTNPWIVIMTDASGVTKEYIYDARGRIAQINEDVDGQQLATRYTHDLLGRLIRVLDSKFVPFTTEYDSLGRKTRTHDIFIGEWTYKYDDAGNLTEKTDAIGQKTVNKYDLLQRLLTSESYDEDGALIDTVKYEYDTPVTPGQTVFKGQMSRATDSEGAEIMSYDSRGRMVELTRYVGMNYTRYKTEFVYDDLDRLVTTRYPFGALEVHNFFDESGMLIRVENALRGAPTEVVFEVEEIDSWNRVKAFSYGNGLETRYAYDSHVRRLLNASVFDGSTALQDLDFTYTARNNIRSITDNVNTGSASLSYSHVMYDTLGRLKEFTRFGNTQTVNYDSVGNIASQTEGIGGTYAYAGGVKLISTAGGAIDYEYDLNGNITKRGRQDLAYDARNRLREVSTNSSKVTFGYTHDDSRLWKRNGSKVTVWIGSIYQEINDEVILSVKAGDRRILDYKLEKAKVQNEDLPLTANSIEYIHTDHLSSTSLLTDENGNVVQRYNYDAFGSKNHQLTPGSSVGSSRLYTSQDFDASTGLYFYQSRYYDPTIGRFMQPDSIIPNPYDPQTLNRYSYVRNNPLRYIDPSGHLLAEVFIGAFLGALGSAITGADIADGAIMGAFTGGFGVLGTGGRAIGAFFGAVVTDNNPALAVANVAIGEIYGSNEFGTSFGQNKAGSYAAEAIARDLYWFSTTSFASGEVGKIANDIGVPTFVLNATLKTLSAIGNHTTATRYNGSRSARVETADGTFKNINYLQLGGLYLGRAESSGSALRGGLGIPFDAVDLLLTLQGELTATDHDALIGQAETGVSLIVGNSLGAFGAANLVARGHFQEGILTALPVGMAAPAKTLPYLFHNDWTSLFIGATSLFAPGATWNGTIGSHPGFPIVSIPEFYQDYHSQH